MESTKTVEELVYAMRDSLTVISVHAQLLLARQSLWHNDIDDLVAIHEAAERAAAFLHMVPPPATQALSIDRQQGLDRDNDPARGS